MTLADELAGRIRPLRASGRIVMFDVALEAQRYVKRRERSRQLEERVWALVVEGKGGTSIGKALGISRQHVNKLIRRRREAQR